MSPTAPIYPLAALQRLVSWLLLAALLVVIADARRVVAAPIASQLAWNSTLAAETASAEWTAARSTFSPTARRGRSSENAWAARLLMEDSAAGSPADARAFADEPLETPSRGLDAKLLSRGGTSAVAMLVAFLLLRTGLQGSTLECFWSF
eukprot:TRINITY_DN96981_c0_g1_i1.p1 TRINITY_DN96981_c0_g1~~TRINITY_DN96981_c0_g1_i1.p1  ORF type:complete len:171 (+),score=16.77 TRINITY_DN96981_c0_g1_i1:66-515(+)